MAPKVTIKLQRGITACGIETHTPAVLITGAALLQRGITACGIETQYQLLQSFLLILLQRGITACGIETIRIEFNENKFIRCNGALPLAVLKRIIVKRIHRATTAVATGHYRLRYWNHLTLTKLRPIMHFCNGALPLAVLKQQYSTSTPRAATLQLGITACGIETDGQDFACHCSFRLQRGITACGIETPYSKYFHRCCRWVATGHYRLRYWNNRPCLTASNASIVATGHYRLRYWNRRSCVW